MYSGIPVANQIAGPRLLQLMTSAPMSPKIRVA